MLVLNRYLVKEVLYALIAVVVALLLIFVSGELISLYGKAASGGLPVKSVLTLLGLNSITNLVFLLPLSAYIAILLGFSRLYRDNEMVVLAACGIGHHQIVRAFLWPALVCAVLMAGLVFYLAPWAENQGEQLINQVKERTDLEAVSAGRFTELTKAEGVVYTQEFNENAGTMGNVFLQRDWQGKSSIITSANGRREQNPDSGERYFILYNGYRYDTETKTGRSAIVKFSQHGVRLEDEQQKPRIQVRQRSMTTKELWQKGELPEITELQWRTSTVVMTIVLMLLALPLSQSAPRQGRYTKLAMALLIYIIYSNLLNVSRAWILLKKVSPWVGLWWVHVVVIMVAILFYIDWTPLRYRIRLKMMSRI